MFDRSFVYFVGHIRGRYRANLGRMAYVSASAAGSTRNRLPLKCTEINECLVGGLLQGPGDGGAVQAAGPRQVCHEGPGSSGVRYELGDLGRRVGTHPGEHMGVLTECEAG